MFRSSLKQSDFKQDTREEQQISDAPKTERNQDKKALEEKIQNFLTDKNSEMTDSVYDSNKNLSNISKSLITLDKEMEKEETPKPFSDSMFDSNFEKNYLSNENLNFITNNENINENNKNFYKKENSNSFIINNNNLTREQLGYIEGEKLKFKSEFELEETKRKIKEEILENLRSMFELKNAEKETMQIEIQQIKDEIEKLNNQQMSQENQNTIDGDVPMPDIEPWDSEKFNKEKESLKNEIIQILMSETHTKFASIENYLKEAEIIHETHMRKQICEQIKKEFETKVLNEMQNIYSEKELINQIKLKEDILSYLKREFENKKLEEEILRREISKKIAESELANLQKESLEISKLRNEIYENFENMKVELENKLSKANENIIVKQEEFVTSSNMLKVQINKTNEDNFDKMIQINEASYRRLKEELLTVLRFELENKKEKAEADIKQRESLSQKAFDEFKNNLTQRIEEFDYNKLKADIYQSLMKEFESIKKSEQLILCNENSPKNACCNVVKEELKTSRDNVINTSNNISTSFETAKIVGKNFEVFYLSIFIIIIIHIKHIVYFNLFFY